MNKTKWKWEFQRFQLKKNLYRRRTKKKYFDGWKRANAKFETSLLSMSKSNNDIQNKLPKWLLYFFHHLIPRHCQRIQLLEIHGSGGVHHSGFLGWDQGLHKNGSHPWEISVILAWAAVTQFQLQRARRNKENPILFYQKFHRCLNKVFNTRWKREEN